MDRKTMLEALEQLWRVHFGALKIYRGFIKEGRNPEIFQDLANQEARNVMVLEHLMTEVRKHDAV